MQPHSRRNTTRSLAMDNQFIHCFPPQTSIVKAPLDMWTTPLCAAEEALIEGAREKRQREFRAGRHAAHKALARLEAPFEALLRGDKRQPLWPHGYLGSISHCQEVCLAVCARTTDLAGLGVDVEPLKPLPKGVSRYVHTPREEVFMQHNPELPERLVFSAKESLYKCYYPILGQFIGFQAVNLEINPVAQTFGFSTSPESDIPFPEALQFHGCFAMDGTHLYTGCYLSHGNIQREN
ncbi:MAG: 4'-phosphopantetheinyl transferase superfamily protein [Candidatus Thiodiazotropha sp.]